MIPPIYQVKRKNHYSNDLADIMRVFFGLILILLLNIFKGIAIVVLYLLIFLKKGFFYVKRKARKKQKNMRG